VKSKARRSFWEYFYALPQSVQELAKDKFRLWRRDPFHHSLQFKELRPNFWSVRINDSYRALAWRHGDAVIWFWIGAHGHYDRLIK
jgi:hypothetical protein